MIDLNARTQGARICVSLALLMAAGTAAHAQTAGSTTGLDRPDQSSSGDLTGGVSGGHPDSLSDAKPPQELRSGSADEASTLRDASGYGAMSGTIQDAATLNQEAGKKTSQNAAGGKSVGDQGAVSKSDPTSYGADGPSSPSDPTAGTINPRSTGVDPALTGGVIAVMAVMGGTMATLSILGRKRGRSRTRKHSRSHSSRSSEK